MPYAAREEMVSRGLAHKLALVRRTVERHRLAATDFHRELVPVREPVPTGVVRICGIPRLGSAAVVNNCDVVLGVLAGRLNKEVVFLCKRLDRIAKPDIERASMVVRRAMPLVLQRLQRLIERLTKLRML